MKTPRTVMQVVAMSSSSIKGSSFTRE
jgi:hypothetical protein